MVRWNPASRLPRLLARYHRNHPAVRVELTTGTTDALVEAVLSRKIEAAFVAECQAPARLEVLPLFSEELVVVAPSSHAPIRRAQDVCADTVISFPSGCAYRRRLQAWLATGSIAPEKVLELGSYHAIVACVASGAGIAFVPRSVLQTLRAPKGIAVWRLPAKSSRITTSLVWRKGEVSSALKALQVAIASFKNGAKAAKIRSGSSI